MRYETLRDTSHNTLSDKLIHAGTYKPVRSTSTREKNRNLHKFTNLVRHFQEIIKKIS